MARTSEAADETDALLNACLQDSVGRGQAPALIAGDLNLDWTALPVAPYLRTAGWADVSDRPTCATVGALEPKRLDVMLRNRQLCWRSLDSELEWATGLPTQAAQTLVAEFRTN